MDGLTKQLDIAVKALENKPNFATDNQLQQEHAALKALDKQLNPRT
jgi:hypothetical protein